MSFSLEYALKDFAKKYPSYATMLAVSKKIKDTISGEMCGNSFI